MFKKSTSLVTAFAIAAGGIAFAASHGSPHESAIKSRQGLMRLFSHNIGTLVAMARGDVEYDAETASVAATQLNTLANLDHALLWPQGSDNMSAPNTRALPEIWDTYPAIVDKIGALTAATATMETAAGDGLDAMRGALGDVGKACGSCHEDFRFSED